MLSCPKNCYHHVSNCFPSRRGAGCAPHPAARVAALACAAPQCPDPAWGAPAPDPGWGSASDPVLQVKCTEGGYCVVGPKRKQSRLLQTLTHTHAEHKPQPQAITAVSDQHRTRNTHMASVIKLDNGRIVAGRSCFLC